MEQRSERQRRRINQTNRLKKYLTFLKLKMIILMKKIFRLTLLFVAFFSAHTLLALPSVQFTSSTISVRQDAGVIEIPVSITGAKDPANSADPTFQYYTQSGTAGRNDYNGTSGTTVTYSNYDGVSANAKIIIRIYYTGDTANKFFTVNVSPYRATYNGAYTVMVGSPSSITVTILGYQPPPKPVAQFTSATIAVRQDVGTLNIPVSITGPKDTSDVADPVVYAETQAGSTSSGYGYDGFSKTAFTALNYNGVSGFANISIPIYYTGDTANKFFTVLLSPSTYSYTSSNVTVGTPSAITVTILGYQPPPPVYYSVTLQASPRSKGSVSPSATYVQGKSITVAAYPKKGKKFVKWTENGTKVSSSRFYSFTVTTNRNLVAKFR
jgi:hypothetical protein